MPQTPIPDFLMPSDQLTSFGFQFQVWIPVLAVVLLAAAFAAYYRTTPAVAGRLRWLLVALRATAFALLVVVLLDPRHMRSVENEQPARVVVLVDRSASMSLPAGEWGAPGPSRFEVAGQLRRQVVEAVERGGAQAQTVYFSAGLSSADSDSIGPTEQGTDIEGALAELVRRNEGENLTAIVLVSDGIDTEERIVRSAAPGVNVFAVGVGDTAAPDDVRIRDVDYNSVVRVPSRAIITATLSYSGQSRKRVSLTLIENSRTIFKRDTVLAPSTREVEIQIPVRFREPGRREFDLQVDVSGYDAEPENNRRDIVIEAEKAKAHLVIVDMVPGWELHFLTDFLRRDQTYDFDVVTTPRNRATAHGKLITPDEFVPRLDKADALIIASLDDDILTPQHAEAVRRFVNERGGGLLVLPGTASLFEQPLAWDRLDDLLPVTGRPPFRFNLQYTSLFPGEQAAANPITAHLMPLFSQTDWQERSPLLGFYASVTPKRVSEVLLNVKGRSLPAITYRTVGKGRVVVVSVGPLWRWKFLSDNNTVYDEILSRLLDVLSRGEEADRFVVSARKNVFEAGEAPTFYAEIFNERMQPVTSAPVRLEITRIDDDGAETPLDLVSMSRENTQSTRFRRVLSPLPPGRYLVRGQADLGERSITSKPVEIRVSNTSVEFQRVHQDRAALVSLALRSGGMYAGARVDAIIDRLPLDARSISVVRETTLRTSVWLFLLILSLLSAEWLIRKRAGMI